VYPVSARFKEAVRGSHVITVRVEVWQGDVQLAVLEPLAGAVEVDARRTHRRTCQVTLAAVNGIVPGVEPGIIAPYGNELRIWRGVRFTDTATVVISYGQLALGHADYQALQDAFGSYGALRQEVVNEFTVDEEVPLGVFFITELDVASDDGATVTLQGVDRSLRISRNRWLAPYTTETDDTLDVVIREILQSRWQQVDYDFETLGVTVPQATLGLDTSNDPFKDAQDIAIAAGYDLFFDNAGVAVLVPQVSYRESDPDETYLEGPENLVVTVQRGLSNDRSYNVVVATGEGTKNRNRVFRGEAFDDDPDSPTYRFGPYGSYPRFYNSSLITSDEQAQDAAEAILARSRGLVEAVEWVQTVDPSLDAGDVIRVQNVLANVDRVFVIDRLTVPLEASGAMQAVARTIRVTGGFDVEEAE